MCTVSLVVDCTNLLLKSGLQLVNLLIDEVSQFLLNIVDELGVCSNSFSICGNITSVLSNICLCSSETLQYAGDVFVQFCDSVGVASAALDCSNSSIDSLNSGSVCSNVGSVLTNSSREVIYDALQ